MAVKAVSRSLLYRAIGPARNNIVVSRVHDMIGRAMYSLDGQGRTSAKRLTEMGGIHEGQRCFILGNGPSLKEMDLTPLKHEFTFGLNRIYLFFEKLGFATTFLVSVNRYVVQQFGAEIAAQPCTKFISWRHRSAWPQSNHPIYVRSTRTPQFSEDPALHGVWEGATVTYVAMQLAYFLGFSEVVLIGVDHSFATPGNPNTLVRSETGDPNHFDASYFGKGTLWQLPDLETSEVAYAMAKRQFEQDGRRIVDATVGGKLQVFEKVSFEGLFLSPRGAAAP